MNESFKRITEWAKAHPALSIGIAAVLVVVGYLAYKKVGGSSGSTMTTTPDVSGGASGGAGDILPEEVPPASQPFMNYFTTETPNPLSDAYPAGDYAISPTAFSGVYKGAVEATLGKVSVAPKVKSGSENSLQKPHLVTPIGTLLSQLSYGKGQKEAVLTTSVLGAQLTNPIKNPVNIPAAKGKQEAGGGKKTPPPTTPPYLNRR